MSERVDEARVVRVASRKRSECGEHGGEGWQRCGQRVSVAEKANDGVGLRVG